MNSIGPTLTNSKPVYKRIRQTNLLGCPKDTICFGSHLQKQKRLSIKNLALTMLALPGLHQPDWSSILGLTRVPQYDCPTLLDRSFPSLPKSKTTTQEFKQAGFLEEDIECIRRTLTFADYGKDLEKLKHTEVRYEEGGELLRLIDFNYPGVKKNSKKMVGVCQELSSYLGRALQEELGHHYEFLVVYGNSPEYFHVPRSNHVFIIAFPPSEIPRIQAYFRKFTEQDNHHDKENDTRVRFPLPPNVLLIDPSYPRTFGLSQHSGPYYLKGVNYELALPWVKQWAPSDIVQKPGQNHPIDYLRELDPDFAQNTEYGNFPDALVYFSYENRLKQGKPPQIVLTIQKEGQEEFVRLFTNSKDEYDGDRWLNTLPTEHPLRVFMESVNRQLTEQYKQENPSTLRYSINLFSERGLPWLPSS